MNVIREIINKYGGNYSENLEKSITGPVGEYKYQPKQGVLEVEGSKISIKLAEVGGAMPVTEPFRITLHLNEEYDAQLSIFPKSIWNNISDLIMPKKNRVMPEQIGKRFSFLGNPQLLKQLASEKLLAEKLLDERIYIETGNVPVKRITLTPENGVETVEKMKKYISLLKLIEGKVKNCTQL